MPRLLILLTLPPDVTEQYRARLSRLFPEITIDVVADKAKAESAIKAADMLLTFGQMLKNLKFDLKDAVNLKWIQALGTGLDGITDQPSLRPGVTVTSLHVRHRRLLPLVHRRVDGDFVSGHGDFPKGRTDDAGQPRPDRRRAQSRR